MIKKTDLSSTPTHSGVYIFYEKNAPIYIGKAVSLKARLLSHWQNSRIDDKERLIINRATKIKCLATRGEFDALLLEAQLISLYQPIYNVVLRDERSFLYIKITAETYPKISVVRRENDGVSKYFGPFESTRVPRTVIHFLRKIIPFCTQKKLGRTGCFYSKIGLCHPCPSIINRGTDPDLKKALTRQYRANIRKLESILSGRSELVMNSLEKQLKAAVSTDDFETGLEVRNQITLFRELLYTKRFGDYNPMMTGDNNRYRQDLSEFISQLTGNASPEDTIRIECYDISHLFGRAATGSMIVSVNGLLDHSQYRKFKIKGNNRYDDTRRMSEVLTRRLKRADWPLPNLIVIDGGRAQVNVAKKILVQFKQDIPVIGLVKRPDRIVSGVTLKTVPFNNRTPIFRLLQEMRDESHRFAKKYHLLLRSRKMV